MRNISLSQKNDEQFQTSQSLSEYFGLVFYTQYLIFWEQWLKEILSCHPWEPVDIDVLLYGR